MSEQKRYFQDGSYVVYTRPFHSEAVERYTEVKVVPLDAVVIDGPLPEVTAREDGTAHYTHATFNGTTYGPPVYAAGTENADAVHAQGLARIALARHLREHPPVDEAQVKALADVLREETVYTQPGVVARRLVKRGVRVEER